MRLGRQLARVVAGVIVLIAAYLVPSAVQAHAGHHHVAPAVVSAPEAAPAPGGIAVPVPGTAKGFATRAKLLASAVIAAPDLAAPAPLKRCTGPCCCSTGAACCCLHALTADVGGGAPMRLAVRLVPGPDERARPGVDPEALPKPPRPFA